MEIGTVYEDIARVSHCSKLIPSNTLIEVQKADRIHI